MAFDAGAVVGRIELEYKGAINALKEVEQKTKTSMGATSSAVADAAKKSEASMVAVGAATQKAMAASAQSVASFKQKLSEAAMGMVVVGGAITAFMYKAVKGAMEEESALFRLEAAIKASGKAIDAAKLVRLAEDLMKVTPFTHEATEAMMSMLIAMKFNEQEVIALTPRIQSLSLMFGRDLESSARALGMAFQGGVTRGLRQFGIFIDPAILKSKDFALFLREIDKTAAGAADRISKSMGSSLAMLANEVGELSEDIGKQLLPAMREYVIEARKAAVATRDWIAAHADKSGILTAATARLGLFMTALGGLLLLLPRLAPLFSGPGGLILLVFGLANAFVAAGEALGVFLGKAGMLEGLKGWEGALTPLPAYAPANTKTTDRNALMRSLQTATSTLYELQGAPQTKAVKDRMVALKQSIDALSASIRKLDGAAQGHTYTLKEISAAYKRAEDSASAYGWSTNKEVKFLDALLAAHKKYLSDQKASGPEGLALLGTITKRRAELLKQQTDDAKKSVDEAAATRQKALEKEIADFELWAARLEQSGRALSAQAMGAGYERILARALASGAAKEFPEIHKQLIEKAIQFSNDAMTAVSEALAKAPEKAFMGRVAAAGMFLPQMKEQGDSLLDILDKLTAAYGKLGEAADQSWRYITKVFDAAAEFNTRAGKDYAAFLSDMVARSSMTADAVKDTLLDAYSKIGEAAQPKVLTPWQQAMEAISEVGKQAARNIQDAFANAIYGMMKHMGSLREFVLNVWDVILQAISQIIAAIVIQWIAAMAKMKEAQKGVGGGGGGIWGAVKGFAQGFAASGGNPWVGAAGAVAAMSEGGIVTKPTVAMIGEHGPEAVIPLHEGGKGMGGTSLTIENLNLGVDSLDEMSLRRLMRRLNAALGHEMWRGGLRTSGARMGVG